MSPSGLPQWQKNQIAISASASGIWLGTTLVMPFLPTYVRQLGVEGTGAIAFWTGLIFSVSPALAALTGPVWGRIGDRFGLKSMAVRAAAGNCLCWLLMAWAADVWQLFLLRAVLGVLGGFNNISVAAITQLAPKEKIPRVIGALQSVQIVSAAVGPFAGGVMAQTIGIRNTFFATALIILGSVLSIVFLYQDAERRPRPETAATEEPPDRSYLRRPEYLLPMLVLFAVQMTDRTYTPIIPLFLEQLGTPATRLVAVSGALFSIAALGEAFSAWLSGRLASRIPLHRLMLARLGLGVVVLAPIALAETATAFFVWRIALALVAGGILTLAFTAAGDVIPGEHRGSGYSILSSTLMAGGSIGPVAAGILAGLSIRAVFVFNIAVYVLLIAAVVRYGRR